MCFILASVPYGLSTTMSYSMAGGGSANMVWGWVLVSLIMLCVAASLAEITSVYPTAGGVYYQTFALSPAWCRRVSAWVCGWAYVAGTITITLAVNFATALFLIESLNVFESGGVGITDNFQTYQIYLIFLGITLLCHAIPAFGNKWLTHLEVIIISIALELHTWIQSHSLNPMRCIDFCHLLDLGRCHRHHCYHTCRCKARQTISEMGLLRFWTSIRMAGWLVFLYRFTPSSVWSFRVWNDNFVCRSFSPGVSSIVYWSVQTSTECARKSANLLSKSRGL